jgi:hypothetical protein
MVQQRIRYTEKFPKEQEIVFNSGGEFNEFFNNRIEEVGELLGWYDKDNPNYQKYSFKDWIHSHVRLNKDGSPRKYNPASQLQTPESRAKQKVKWQEYQDRKKKEKINNDELIKENYHKALQILVNNQIDITKLKIEPKFPHF